VRRQGGGGRFGAGRVCPFRSVCDATTPGRNTSAAPHPLSPHPPLTSSTLRGMLVRTRLSRPGRAGETGPSTGAASVRAGAKPATTTSAGVGRRDGAPAAARAAMEAEPAAKDEPPEPRGGRHSGRRREPPPAAVKERGAEEAGADVPLTSQSKGRVKGTMADRTAEPLAAAVGVDAREEGLAAVALVPRAAVTAGVGMGER
jgi:hypothetical protein